LSACYFKPGKRFYQAFFVSAEDANNQLAR
jgi:hypothetical protein